VTGRRSLADRRRCPQSAPALSLSRSRSRSIDSPVLMPLRLCDLVRGHRPGPHGFETVKPRNIQPRVDFGLPCRPIEPVPNRDLVMSGSVRDISDGEAAEIDQLNYGDERGAIVGFSSPHTSAEAAPPHVSCPQRIPWLGLAIVAPLSLASPPSTRCPLRSAC
jgi:hypothetical protein